MTTAAATTHIDPLKTALGFAALGLLAAVIAGGALLQRAPDPIFLPVMADRPVMLPNGRALYVQRHEVTVTEWARCFAQDACAQVVRARADQDPATTPATGLSYIDVQDYLAWINDATGHAFRLPTAGEWTIMAASVLPDEPDPIFTDPSLTWASAYLTEGTAPRALKPQGSFTTSPEGIADLDGSVWEWTQECYAGASDGMDASRCPAFFVGGEHVAAMSYLVRDPARGGCAVGTPPAHLGMRLVSDSPI
ncbi:Formylglycine-generating sulfatase enzyme [Roseovarius tolerans]|uniref:Formylglycine-generating sulfatase enzyme n=1 Tax=Roseovarius tolerans TaxID=74031 RepID=A0A0L6CV93_9RHOB|nr:SUMF1/EgtB/PvdO family nonheme iron enzyme [Roseovarius tolerans]KNX41595.1 Formylglycine-generating sulfatase enzyme [Roseovarius tolerans]